MGLKLTSIRSRLILLLLSLILVFIAATVMFWRSEKKALVLFFEKEIDYKKTVFDKLLELKGKSIETLAYDYTYWDEMVNFIEFSDLEWAKTNVDTCLSTYDINAVWVYKPDFSFVYSVNNLDAGMPGPLPLEKETLEKIFAGNKFCHFFLDTPAGLFEIRGASVHPSDDDDRKTPAHGYFLDGRLWSREYILELSELTNTQIELLPVKGAEYFADTFNPDNGTIYFSRALSDWSAKPLMRLNISAVSNSITNFNAMSKKYFLMLLASSGLILGIFAIFIVTWVGMPLRLVSRALKTEDSRHAKALLNNKTEFGDIARLIDKFFTQRSELLNEMSERLKITEALRVSKESFHNIVERSADGVVVTDLEGKVRFLNLAAHAFFGRKYLLGKAFMYPLSKDEMREIEIIRPNGEKGTGELRVAATEWDGSPSYLVSVIDITREKQMQKTKRLAELGKLVADMAHEVNNPLMVISGLAQISLMDNIDNPEIKKNFEVIFGEAQRAKDIIQRLLKFSRPSKGQFREADVNKILEDVILLIEHQFKLDNVEIKRNFMHNPPPVMLDAQQMQEVFINVLNNARDAMPNGGVIEATTMRKDGSLRIDFKDSGSGMPKEVMEKVFEPFFTTKERGTGLGLPLCYGIIKSHNGELQIESAPGAGTLVSILLPVKEDKPDA